MLLFESVTCIGAWCGVRSGDVVRVCVPSDRRGSSRERSIRTPPCAIAIRIAVVHRLTIAASSDHSHVVAAGSRGTHGHRCLAVIVRIGSRIGGTANGRRASLCDGHIKAACVAAVSRSGDCRGTNWEEAIVAMVSRNVTAGPLTTRRCEVNNGSVSTIRVVRIFFRVSRRRDVTRASKRTSSSAGAFDGNLRRRRIVAGIDLSRITGDGRSIGYRTTRGTGGINEFKNSPVASRERRSGAGYGTVASA